MAVRIAINGFGRIGRLVLRAVMESKRDELSKRLDEFFTRYSDPKYDIWKGGISRARRLVAD